MSSFSIETYRPHEMSKSEMDLLIDVVREPFDWYAPESTNKDILDRLQGNKESYVDVVLLGGVACGFASSYTTQCGEPTVGYRAGTSIMPSARGRGIYKALINLSLDRTDFDYIATRTQNPRVYETLKQFTPEGTIFPQPKIKPPKEILEIARATCENGVVEPETLIVRGVHGFVREDRSFMTARSKPIQDFFIQSLGCDDGFMVVVQL